MKKFFGNLFVSLIAGLWMFSKVTQCQTFPTRISLPYCFDTRSGKICFTTILANNNHRVRKPFEEASDLCKVNIPGSSLVVIKSLKIQRAFERFIHSQMLQNEAIILDATMLSTNESQAWSWVIQYGHPYFPDVSQDVRNTAEKFHDGGCVELKHGQSMAYCFDNVASRFGYICENSTFNHRQGNMTYMYTVNEGLATWYDARKNCLRSGGDLASITDLQPTKEWLSLKQNQKYWIGLHRNKWIWNSTGAALTYTNWKNGLPDESSDKQCICFSPKCRRENECELATDRKWRTCDCNNNYTIVCQKEENSNASRTKTSVTKVIATSTSEDFKSSAFFSVKTSTKLLSSLPSTTSLSTIATSSAQSLNSKLSTTRTNPAINTTAAIATTTSTKTPGAATTKTTITSTETLIATTTTTYATTVTTTAFKPDISSVPTFTATIADNTTEAIYWKTVSTSHFTQKPTNYFSVNQTNPFVSSSTSPSTGLSSKQQILLILLLLVAVVFILAAVILVIRKRRYDRRNDGLPNTNTNQSETVSSVYAAVVPVNRPSEGTVTPGNTIYSDVEMTQQPTTSNTIYASVHPTCEAVDIGKSVVYADLDLQKKDQQKPKSADKTTACLSPIYSQPFESPSSDSNTDYVEPYKPDKNPPPTAPVQSHNAAADQQSVYSLAKAIPLGDPNAIYSEPNKPTKSSEPTGKAVKATDPIYQEAIEVNHGAGSGGVTIQDPSAVYAEPMKLKKSP